MTDLTFTLRFHGPFAVSTGQPRDGVDATVDASNPLPSSALKGLLRAQLEHALHAPKAQIRALFHDSGWVFSDGIVVITRGLWTRVKVDEDGRAEERFFMLGEQAFARSGTFTISWTGPGMPPADQVAALRAAARHVTSLGSHRRRGLGWVSIVDDAPWSRADSVNLLGWLHPEQKGVS